MTRLYNGFIKVKNLIGHLIIYLYDIIQVFLNFFYLRKKLNNLRNMIIMCADVF